MSKLFPNSTLPGNTVTLRGHGPVAKVTLRQACLKLSSQLPWSHWCRFGCVLFSAAGCCLELQQGSSPACYPVTWLESMGEHPAPSPLACPTGTAVTFWGLCAQVPSCHLVLKLLAGDLRSENPRDAKDTGLGTCGGVHAGSASMALGGRQRSICPRNHPHGTSGRQGARYGRVSQSFSLPPLPEGRGGLQEADWGPGRVVAGSHTFRLLFIYSPCPHPQFCL